MQVDKITPQHNNKPYFEGQYFIRNRRIIPYDLLRTIEKAPFLKGMTQNNDVVIRPIIDRVSHLDTIFTGDKVFYNVSFSVLPENSLFARIIDALHMIKRHRISSSSQPKNDIIFCLEDPAHIASLKRRCHKTKK